MSEINSRQLRLCFIAACVGLIAVAGDVRGQSISIRPDGLRVGDGKTRNVTLEASVRSGASLTVSVNYRSDGAGPEVTFIPKFVVQDNATEDRDRREGQIRLVLPKAFDKTGVYIIEVDETRTTIRLVHEPNNSSYFRQIADWLIGAAGGGERSSQPQSAIERIEEVTRSKGQNKVGIWTAAMPASGQQIGKESQRLRITSAVMPAWSTKGKYVACSAWRRGRWLIAAFKISLTGEARQLWQWTLPNSSSSDFSPAWSPDGHAIAFVRQNQDKKSDVWILHLDRNNRPKREVKFTDVGDVQGLLGWDRELGILFETKESTKSGPLRQIWSSGTNVEEQSASTRQIPLSDAYSLYRGGVPQRRTLVLSEKNDAPPFSVLYEMNSSGKQSILLVGDFCLLEWPTVSADGRSLAFESDCPRSQQNH